MDRGRSVSKWILLVFLFHYGVATADSRRSAIVQDGNNGSSTSLFDPTSWHNENDLTDVGSDEAELEESGRLADKQNEILYVQAQKDRNVKVDKKTFGIVKSIEEKEKNSPEVSLADKEESKWLVPRPKSELLSRLRRDTNGGSGKTQNKNQQRPGKRAKRCKKKKKKKGKAKYRRKKNVVRGARRGGGRGKGEKNCGKERKKNKNSTGKANNSSGAESTTKKNSESGSSASGGGGNDGNDDDDDDDNDDGSSEEGDDNNGGGNGSGDGGSDGDDDDDDDWGGDGDGDKPQMPQMPEVPQMPGMGEGMPPGVKGVEEMSGTSGTASKPPGMAETVPGPPGSMGAAHPSRSVPRGR